MKFIFLKLEWESSILPYLEVSLKSPNSFRNFWKEYSKVGKLATLLLGAPECPGMFIWKSRIHDKMVLSI